MLRSLSVLVVGLVISLAAANTATAQACAADCNGDNEVGINELITCVGIALVGGPTTGCPPCDGDGDGTVAVNEIIAGVNSALDGCVPVDLPDLAPVSARLRSTTPACITDTSEIQIRLEVCVANQGTVDSGPFNIAVLGEPFGRVNSLAHGAETCIQGPFVPFSIDVLVDADHEVAETDEFDNFDTFFVPQPSPPPFCEPTGSPTETPTITETPTPGDTDTPTPEVSFTSTAEATSTSTSADTETPTPATTSTAVDTETPTPESTHTATAVDTETPTPDDDVDRSRHRDADTRVDAHGHRRRHRDADADAIAVADRDRRAERHVDADRPAVAVACVILRRRAGVSRRSACAPRASARRRWPPCSRCRRR